MNHQPSEQNDSAPFSDPASPSHAREYDPSDLPLLSAGAPALRRTGGKSNSPVLQPRARSVPAATGTALALRSATSTQQCPSCGAMQSTSTSVCMACGTFLPAKSQHIRCRRCGRQASANLMLCPGCGRELQAAAPRLLSWFVPVVLVVLFFLFLQQWVGPSVLTWGRTQLATGWQWITEVGERFDPQVTIETIPIESADTGSVVANLTDANTLTSLIVEPLSAVDTDSALAESSTGENNADPKSAVVQTSSDSTVAMSTTVDAGGGEGATAIVLQNAPRPPEREPSPTAVPTATAEPMATATTAPTLAPSATLPPPTAPSQATATGRARVASGEPLVRIKATATPAEENTAAATLTPVTIPATVVARISETPAAAADQPADDQQVVASVLQPTPFIEPSATSVPSPTPVPPTATPPAAVTTYRVQAGDTPLGIAGRFDIGVNELLAANGLTVADARRLRVGQELIVPVLGQATVPAATSTAAVTTATAPVPSATATPVATAASAMRLDLPQLRSPESGSSLSCGGENSLVWLPVNFMREDDRYLLHLGFLNGYNTDGAETVVWVLEQLQPANATIWRMDEALCSLAPQDFGRQWRWYVEAVEPAGAVWQPVSLPSAIWAFSWN